jgi:hypothetical protein
MSSENMLTFAFQLSNSETSLNAAVVAVAVR